MHILFICTGNTCRSPMAEALLNSNSKKNTAESAGMFVPFSSHASENAILVMQEYGIDISAHLSRQVTEKMVRDAELILTMTDGHKNALLSVFPDIAAKTFTLPQYAGEKGDVEDPFGGDEVLYRSCAANILHYIKEGDL